MEAWKLLTLPKRERDRSIALARAMMRHGIGADVALNMTVDTAYDRFRRYQQCQYETAHIRATQA